MESQAIAESPSARENNRSPHSHDRIGALFAAVAAGARREDSPTKENQLAEIQAGKIPWTLIEDLRLVPTDDPASKQFQVKLTQLIALVAGKNAFDIPIDDIQYRISKLQSANACTISGLAPIQAIFQEGLFQEVAYTDPVTHERKRAPVVETIEEFLLVVLHEICHQEFRRRFNVEKNSKIEEGTAYSKPMQILADAGIDPNFAVTFYAKLTKYDVKHRVTFAELMDEHPHPSNIITLASDTLAAIRKSKGVIPSGRIPNGDAELAEIKSLMAQGFHESHVLRAGIGSPEFRALPANERLDRLVSYLDSIDILLFSRVDDLRAEFRLLSDKLSHLLDGTSLTALADRIIEKAAYNRRAPCLQLYTALEVLYKGDLAKFRLGSLRPIDEARKALIDACASNDSLSVKSAATQLVSQVQSIPSERFKASLCFLRTLPWSEFPMPTFKKGLPEITMPEGIDRNLALRAPPGSPKVSWQPLIDAVKSHPAAAEALGLMGLGGDYRLHQAILETKHPLRIRYAELFNAKEDKVDELAERIVPAMSQGPREGGFSYRDLCINRAGFTPGISKDVYTRQAVANTSQGLCTLAAGNSLSALILEPSTTKENRLLIAKCLSQTGFTIDSADELRLMKLAEIDFDAFLILNVGDFQTKRLGELIQYLSSHAEVGTLETYLPSIRRVFLGERNPSGEIHPPLFELPSIASDGAVLENQGKGQKHNDLEPWIVFWELVTRGCDPEIVLSGLARWLATEDFNQIYPAAHIESLNKGGLEKLLRRMSGNEMLADSKPPRSLSELITEADRDRTHLPKPARNLYNVLYFSTLLRLQPQIARATGSQFCALLQHRSAGIGVPINNEIDGGFSIVKTLRRRADAYFKNDFALLPISDAIESWIGAVGEEFFSRTLLEAHLHTLLDRHETSASPSELYESAIELLAAEHIVDTALRERVVCLAEVSALRLFGIDDGSPEYLARIRPSLESLLRSGIPDALQAIDRIVEKIELQKLGADWLHSERFRPLETLSSSFAVMGIVSEATLAGLTRTPVFRRALLDYLLGERQGPECDDLLKQFDEKVLMEIYRFQTGGLLSENPDELYEYDFEELVVHRPQMAQLLRNAMGKVHDNYWSIPSREAQAIIARELLIDSNRPKNELQLPVLQYALGKVLPSSGEYSHQARHWGTEWIRALEYFEQHIYLGAIVSAGRKEGKTRLRTGQALAYLVEQLDDPASHKSLQNAASNPRVPKSIRKDTQHVTFFSRKPSRVSIVQQVEEQRSAIERAYQESTGRSATIKHIGRILGAASIFVVPELEMSDGSFLAAAMLRADTGKRAEGGFRIIGRMAENIAPEMGSRILPELTSHAARYIPLEMNTRIAPEQIAILHQIYSGVKATTGSGTFTMKGVESRGSGDTFYLMKKESGRPPAVIYDSNEDIEYRKDLAITNLTVEFSNILQGRFDRERNFGQSLVDGFTITQLDAKCLIPREWSDDELAQLGRLLGKSFALAVSKGGGQFMEFALEAESALVKSGEAIGEIIREFQLAGNAIGGHADMLDQAEVYTALLEAWRVGVHPTIEKAIRAELPPEFLELLDAVRNDPFAFTQARAIRLERPAIFIRGT